MAYAFGVTTPKPSVISLEPSDQQLLPQFVAAAHKHGVKASLSIGGWTGSRYFSTNVGSSKNRTAFLQAVTNLVQQYSLDGVDFDWEFPGLQGIGCNIVNSNDTSNFLAFLKELRATSIGKSLVLTAAVYTKPFTDTTGQPSTNLSEFSEVLDHIAIMNYDTKSTPSTGAGPNAPLDDSCAPNGAQLGSAASSVNLWTAAGIPANQIALGVPAYGHSFVIPPSVTLSQQSNGAATTLSLYPMYTPNSTRKGDRWDGDSGMDVCGNPVGPGGIYTYWGLIEEGFLNPDGTIPGKIASRFDNCSHTPFLYDQDKQVFISYDNAESFAAKGNFINITGLAGFAIWEAGGDYKDVLLDSITSAAHNGDPSQFQPPTNAGNKSTPKAPPTSNAQPSPSPCFLHMLTITAASITLLSTIITV